MRTVLLIAVAIFSFEINFTMAQGLDTKSGLARHGIDPGVIQATTAQQRDLCLKNVSNLRSELSEMGSAARRCAAFSQTLNPGENRSERLTELGCGEFLRLENEIRDADQKCTQLNEAVGRLHVERYKNVPKPCPDNLLLPQQSVEEIFEASGCERKWREKSVGVNLKHYGSFRIGALNELKSRVTRQELQSAFESAFFNKDFERFCEKYFPPPEMY